MTRKSTISFILLSLMAILAMYFGSLPSNTSEEISINGADTAWMVTATGLVLLMTPGLAFFYGGMVSRKNVISTMLQSIISLSIVSIIWVLIGFSLAFGESVGGLIGNPFTYWGFKNVGLAPNPEFSSGIPFMLFAFFQLKFAIITPAIVTGSFAERMKFSSYLVFITLFSILIYAPLAHWTWHPEGFLRQWGVLDFAGGTVVHMSAGFAALSAALVLGKRISFNKGHQPANVSFVILGAGLLWFGWFGFNAGSALGANESAVLALSTTHMCSATSMLTYVLFDIVLGRKITAIGASIGAVIGLVAITPAAGFVTIGHSIFIGFAAAVVCNYAIFLKNKSSLDDTLDVFPSHGIGGIVGMLLTAVFAKDVGLIYGETSTFLAHILSLLIVSSFTFGGSFLIFKITDWLIPLRVPEDQEIIGLDMSQHKETFA